MMKHYLVFCMMALTTLSLALPAAANGRDPAKLQGMVSENAGWSCSTPKKGSGTVAGYFRGWEQTPFQNRGSGLLPIERYRCFSTIKECQGWLHTMTYLYNDKTIDTRICKAF